MQSDHTGNVRKHHKTPDKFITQEIDLVEQIFKLNNNIKEINSTINNYTPKFSND